MCEAVSLEFCAKVGVGGKFFVVFAGNEVKGVGWARADEMLAVKDN